MGLWHSQTLPASIRLARRSVTTPRSIRHQPELLLDALEPGTFYDTNCRAGQGDFNGSKVIEKYEDLIPKMRLGILPPRAAPVPNRPAPARISSCALITPPTLGGIIVVLNRLSSSLQNNQKLWRFDLVKKVEDISMRWIAKSSAWQLFPGGRWTSRTEYPTYFERHNCSPESTELNASKIIEKYEGSIQ